MTNPYAPPATRSDPEESSSPSLLKLFLWQAVAGAVWSIIVLLLLHPLVSNHALTKGLLAYAPLGLGIACRAWFCTGGHELVTAALAMSWGLLCTSAILVVTIMMPAPTVDWLGFAMALLIVPALLALIGWPVMYFARRRRNRRNTGTGTVNGIHAA